MKSLRQLYDEHTGKVSDKWALYLEVYDRAFGPYRERPVSLVEVGVQNGGSLEIWSRYFPAARRSTSSSTTARTPRPTSSRRSAIIFPT